MYRNRFILIILVLSILTLACGVDLPFQTEVKTGETITDEIFVPQYGAPGEPAEITLKFGAGELYLAPGAGEAILNGTATYNVKDLKPEVSIANSRVEISTGSLEIDGIPTFSEKVKNVWDLSLGGQAIDLTIKAGAYVGEFELGGLHLVNLTVSDGAAEVQVSFDQPNPGEMHTLRYETGASNIALRKLGNANFNTMIFQSGAGNYDLDFTGDIRRDASVFIETGLSSLTITVPEGINVQVILEGSLTNTSIRGNWEQNGNEYILRGNGPTLLITVEMSAGNLVLRTE